MSSVAKPSSKRRKKPPRSTETYSSSSKSSKSARSNFLKKNLRKRKRFYWLSKHTRISSLRLKRSERSSKSFRTSTRAMPGRSRISTRSTMKRSRT